ERELGSARADVQRLEENAQRDSASNETVLRLQRELDDIRLKAASGQKIGGVSSREFLDLREALNKKDKEILGIRDQLSRKEKELLDANDSALALEREKADLEDKIGALDKDVQAARVLADTAKADKDQAAKRAEDFKSRSEKLKAELDTKSAELATIQTRHQEETAAALAEARGAEQRARDEAIAQLTQQIESDKASAVAARETELRQETEQRFVVLVTSHQEEQNRLKSELAATVEQRDAATTRLAAREGELA